MRTEKIDSLKSWHLARLRMLAHESQSHSPSGLIESDNELLSRLASEYGTNEQESIKLAPDVKGKNLSASIQRGRVAAIIAALSLFQIVLASALAASTIKICLLVSSIISLFLTLFTIKRPVLPTAQLNQIGPGENATKQELLGELNKLRESEKLTFDYSRELLFVLSEDLRIMAVNQSFLKYFAVNKEETLGALFSSFLQTTQTERLLSFFERCRTEHSPLQIEFPVQSAGERRHISIYAEWSASNSGYFCEASDISAAKELEQIKQSFISMISHDLRAPLQSMESGIDLILAGRFGQFPEQAAAKLQAVQSSIHRLMRLTSDLLDLDKMQAGKLSIAKTKLDSRELLQSAKDAVCELADKKEINLAFSCEIPIVYCDAERMVQVLVNLLANAIKYAPPGSKVSVLIRPAGKYAEILVDDEGPGIDNEFAGEVFELYRQIPNNAKQKGFGLGLSISKAIVELHGGKIGLSPSSKKGASFWIRIPNE